MPTSENGFCLAVAFVRRVDVPPTGSTFSDDVRIRLENIRFREGMAPHGDQAPARFIQKGHS